MKLPAKITKDNKRLHIFSNCIVHSYTCSKSDNPSSSKTARNLSTPTDSFNEPLPWS